jgi:hypothetical protein
LRTVPRPADANGGATDRTTVRENPCDSGDEDGADDADGQIPLFSGVPEPDPSGAPIGEDGDGLRGQAVGEEIVL